MSLRATTLSLDVVPTADEKVLLKSLGHSPRQSGVELHRFASRCKRLLPPRLLPRLLTLMARSGRNASGFDACSQPQTLRMASQFQGGIGRAASSIPLAGHSGNSRSFCKMAKNTLAS
jgi:hypothetical protein